MTTAAYSEDGVGMEAAPRQPPVRPLWLRALRVLGALLVSLGIAAGALYLFTRHNDFPTYYHPDEPGKVEQIVSDGQYRNFNHPQLMLEAAHHAWKWYISGRQQGLFRPQYSEIDVAIVGRWTSATLAAIGVFALAMAGFIGYGFPGLFITGAVMGLCPPLLVYAHYFKEDASLVCGIMIALLGARMLVSARNEWTQGLSAIVLGIGCGAAASGKYVGAVTVIPALITLAIARVPNWWSIPTRFSAFILATLLTVVTINHRAFIDWKSLQTFPLVTSKIDEETSHGTGGHYGVALPKPNDYCLRIAASEMMPHLWIFAAAGIGWLIWRRRFSRWGFVLLAFGVSWTAALSQNAIPFARYALPITICAYFISSQLISSLLSDLSSWRRWGHAVAAACVGAVVLFQGARCLNFNNQFYDDSRQRLREYVANHIPANAVVLIDGYTSLHNPGDPHRFPGQSNPRQRIDGAFFASENATSPEDAARRGYDYIAVASSNYGRFFVRGIEAQPGVGDRLTRNRQFYESLFEKGELIWSFVPSPDTHAYVNQELRLYKITHLRNPRPRSGR